MSRRLSDVIAEYEHSMKGQGKSPNTISTQVYACTQFLAFTGNIQIRSVTDRHFDDWFAKQQARGLSPGTLNVQRTAFRGLMRYAQRRRYIPDRSSPVAHIEPFKVMPRERLRIPADRFPHLLDSATHPRDRVITALGVYLFLRASEIQALRVRDLDLAGGNLHVTVQKTKQIDDMPICAELDAELRRWVEYYQADVEAPLEKDWFLVPAHDKPRPYYDDERKRFAAEYGVRHLRPEKRMTEVARIVHKPLVAAGYTIRDERTGKALGEGVHTLRRSGARALFDHLSEQGYDRAVRIVQSMLHHKSSAMTEHYLGISHDQKTRDELVRGVSMFGVASGGNVVPLKAVASGGQGAARTDM